MQRGLKILGGKTKIFFQLGNAKGYPRKLQDMQQSGLTWNVRAEYYQKNTVKYEKEDNTIRSASGKPMDQSSDAGIIKDFDDKFGLAKIGDPSVILNHLLECKFSYSMNDLVYFLRKLASLYSVSKQLKEKREFKVLIEEIKERLEKNTHEAFPLIGSIAKCFKDLEVYDRKLWELLESKINDDQWYTNFKESLNALEGFSILKGTKDQHRIDVLYEKVERIVDLTVWDQNMLDYKRVVEALAEVNRFEPAIFAKIEMYILRNMSLDYELKTIVDILYAFAKGDMGQRQFYDAVQLTLCKGHLFNRSSMLKMTELPLNGETTSKLLSIFSHAMHRISDFQIDPHFHTFMYRMIMNKNTKYTLVTLIDTLKYLSKFDFEEQQKIEEHLIGEIPNVEGTVYLNDVEYAMEYLIYKYCGDFTKVPAAIKHNLFQHVLDRIPSSQPEDLIAIYSFFNKRNLLSGHVSTTFLDKMIHYLNERMIQISPKEIEQLLGQIEKHLQVITDDTSINIVQYAASKQKIQDYLLVCKHQRKQDLIDRSKAEEIPKLPISHALLS